MYLKIKKFIIILIMSFFSTNTTGNSDTTVYGLNFNDLDGAPLKLSEFKNKVIVVVNVASQCGFTKQYEDMQIIWEKYQKAGLIVLGVPSNDFGKQEPGSNTEIKNFCEAKFGITFPMTEKVFVKGEEAHPFYKWAQDSYGKSAVPKWNFHKIIISKKGKVFDTFSSITKPTSKKFINSIEKALN